jgi:hypothetical protein
VDAVEVDAHNALVIDVVFLANGVDANHLEVALFVKYS